MTSVPAETAWSTFRHSFYSSPNELAVGDEAVGGAIGQAEAAWLASPPTPFFLPASVSGWTYWYAICPDEDYRLWVLDLLRSYAGSWIDGKPVPADADIPMDEAVRALIGPRGCAFRVRLPRDADSEARVRESMRRVGRSLAGRPHRRIQLTWPLGRLIGDFSDACAAGADASAQAALAILVQDHRLTRPNKLFLRLQYLAAFEHWDRLGEMEELPDLLHLDRPVLASDALARYAMSRLDSAASIEDFAQVTAEFGSLIGSAAIIRSAAGAQYYSYWSLASGGASEEVAAHLLEAGWLERAREWPGLASLLTSQPVLSLPGDSTASLVDLQQALDSGRLDTAIDVLSLLTPSVDQLPVLVDLVTRTLSTHSIHVLQDWREALGESAIQGALAARPINGQRGIAMASESLGQALQNAFSVGLSATEQAQILDDLSATAVSRLMQAGSLRELIETVRPLSRSVSPVLLGDLIDLLLDMERDLFAAAGDVPGIQDLRLIIVESWALGDESGDRRRAARMLDLVSRMLSTGVSESVFSEIAESLRAGWDPLLTDADLPLGLEAIELLAASQPGLEGAVQALASAVLSRIGAHNARRIEVAYIETARALAQDFGLELYIPAQQEEAARSTGADQCPPPDGTFVAIYSLMEPAATRAAAIVRRWYPQIRVETLTGKVASDALRSVAKNSDVLVIADRAAAHAATDALKAARGSRPIWYALGKGTASLVKAVLEAFDESFGGVLVTPQHD